MFLDLRRHLRKGAHRTRDGAGRDAVARRHQPSAISAEFGISLRQLKSEGGRLGMDAVAAADGRRQLMLKRRAFEHKLTPTIGRSHGIHAEPTTFGLKLAQAYAEFSRNRGRLVAARDGVATCAISGAVGTFAQVPPEVEEHVAAELGLSVEPV